MARKKVRLVRIQNNAARKVCLKKRSVGLCKKAKELSILCGVEAFMIIYSPNEDEPMTWPSPSEIKEIVEKYESIPEMERRKKMTTLMSYLMERNEKNTDKLKKLEKKNRDMELSDLMHKLRRHGDDFNCLNSNEKLRLIWLLEERMKEYRKRLDYLQLVPPLDASNSFLPLVQDQQVLPPSLFPQPSATLPSGFNSELGAYPNDPNSWNRWFTEMMRNSSNVAGGSGSVNALNLLPLSQAFNFNQHGGNGDNVGVHGFGRPFEGGNPFQINMDAPNPNSLEPLPSSFDGGVQRDNVGVHGFGHPFEGGNPFQMDVDPPNPNSLAPLPLSFDGGVQRDGEIEANPINPRAWDPWFEETLANSDNVAGGSGSNALNPSQAFVFNESGGNGDTVGAHGLGHSSEGENIFQMVMDQPNSNPFGINSPNEYFGSVPSNVNSLGLESTLPAIDSSGARESEEELPGYFPSRNDSFGLP